MLQLVLQVQIDVSLQLLLSSSSLLFLNLIITLHDLNSLIRASVFVPSTDAKSFFVQLLIALVSVTHHASPSM